MTHGLSYFDIEKAAILFRDRVLEWRKANSSWFVPSKTYLEVPTWWKAGENCVKHSINPEQAVDAIIKHGKYGDYNFPSLNVLKSEKVLLEAWKVYQRHKLSQLKEKDINNTLHLLKEEVDCYRNLLKGMVKKYNTPIEALLMDETIPIPSEVRLLLGLEYNPKAAEIVRDEINDRSRLDQDFAEDFRKYISKYIKHAKTN